MNDTKKTVAVGNLMTEENKQLLEILRHSLWDGAKRKEEIPEKIRQELCDQTVEGLTSIAYPDEQNLKYSMASWFAQMIHMQSEAVQLLQDAGIPVVVIKGTAAGIYYPHPQLRTYGDIDLLVQPERYLNAIKVLKKGGWHQDGAVDSIHTPFSKNNERLELHQSPSGMEDDERARYIHRFLLSGFSDIQEGVIGQVRYRFPMLPWQQNGLELIWHFRVHLNNGIGLRHAIDWMMFVNACLDDKAFREYRAVLEQAGLLILAKAVTRLCQLYLGLPEKSITWCDDVDDSVCSNLMKFILEQGNFGTKQTDDDTTRSLTRIRSIFSILAGMQRKGLREWAALRKHPVLKPFAWMYVAAQLLTPSGREKVRQARAESSRRKALFDQLYGDNSK